MNSVYKIMQILLLIWTKYRLVAFFSKRRRHARCGRDWSSDVCSSVSQAEDGIRDAEEHTSELQSRPHLVCRLLLGKQKSTSLNSSNVRISYDVLCFQKNALQK